MNHLNLTPDMKLTEAIGITIGRASVCWEPMNGTGVFDSTTASELVDELAEWIQTNEPLTRLQQNLGIKT